MKTQDIPKAFRTLLIRSRTISALITPRLQKLKPKVKPLAPTCCTGVVFTPVGMWIAKPDTSLFQWRLESFQLTPFMKIAVLIPELSESTSTGCSLRINTVKQWWRCQQWFIISYSSYVSDLPLQYFRELLFSLQSLPLHHSHASSKIARLWVVKRVFNPNPNPTVHLKKKLHKK